MNKSIITLRACWTSTIDMTSYTILDHFFNPPSNMTQLYQGASVRLVRANFAIQWGLLVGAIGTVLDIVFANGQKQYNEDVPLYILTEFEQYHGPTCCRDRPKVRKQYICSDLAMHTSRNTIISCSPHSLNSTVAIY